QTSTFGILGILAFTMPINPYFSPREDNHRPESRMREIRMSGSEGGESGQPGFPTPIVISVGSGFRVKPGMRLRALFTLSSSFKVIELRAYARL
ncbi:MAG: hypothetical protein K9K88_18740, partial [Desulfobacterales bacterium]|nr:hypothetical protein [Desulfobacterales bacterium]